MRAFHIYYMFINEHKNHPSGMLIVQIYTKNSFLHLFIGLFPDIKWFYNRIDG